MTAQTPDPTTASVGEQKVHARMNQAWRDTVTIERPWSGERLDISVAEARELAAELLAAADEVEEADR